ncbi:MAG: integration host factor [Coriobacteriales bacterium]|nr:integration host factor [Coriobacteriales bacterium]
MALPPLSAEQRQAALKKAAEVRTKRAEMRKKIESGSLKIADVLKKADDPIVGKAKVSYWLKAVPGLGTAKVAKLMEEFQIAENRRVQGLGSRQMSALIERLG